MRDRPQDFDEAMLRPALKAWGADATTLEYAPVGFGDYHWVAQGRGGPWFVTVVDVRRRAYDEVRAALDTAAELREQAGLDFVVSPLRDDEGATLRRLDSRRYAMSVYPYVEGRPGEFGDAQDDAERAAVIDLLAALHATPPPLSAPPAPVQPPGRALLERLASGEDGDLPWLGGPYSEPARELVTSHTATLRRALEEFDLLAEKPGEPVVTHGEPHPGNLLRSRGRLLLVDWETVGLAAPERDLWLVAKTAEDRARYAEATGHIPDERLMTLYRLRWALDDVADFVRWFRGPHARTPDAAVAWQGLKDTLEKLAGED
ncbi:phosphotransferase [Nonomuraea sp. NPDC049309]|uniref:phosphotransferase n=1 Tax=Nonomuraea sp. NPDC049309 TaxID=3364350 RepID=UPI003722541C